jgi:hypothetical protein
MNCAEERTQWFAERYLQDDGTDKGGCFSSNDEVKAAFMVLGIKSEQS